MPTIDSRVRFLASPQGLGQSLSGIRQILRPVWNYGSILELRDLARSLIAACTGEAYLCALETMDQAFPGESIRPDDELDTFALRAVRFGPPPAHLKGMARAFRLSSSAQEGDLLLLCAYSGTATGLALVMDRLRSPGPWSPLAARLLLWRALELQQTAGPARVLLGSTLADAFACSEGCRHRDVLLAALVFLADRAGRGGQLQVPEEGPVHEELIRIVRSAEEPMIRERLIPLLGVDILSRPAVDALESIRLGQLDPVMAGSGHLLRDPARAAILSGSRFGVRVAGRLSKARPVSDESGRHVPTVITGGSLSRERVIRRLGVLACDPSPLAAVLATQALVQQGLDGSVRSALDEVRRTAPGIEATRLADAALSDTGDWAELHSLDVFVEALSTAPGWWCAASALSLLEQDPAAFRGALRRVLSGSDPVALDNALEVISRRQLVGEFEPDLIRIVDDVGSHASGGLQIACDLRPAIRAMSLLACGPTMRSSRLIIRHLASPFPELQTAAILASTNPRASDAVREGCGLVDVQLLERLAGASDHRVRAAALRGLRNRSRRHSDVVMRRLLDHESPEYRLTGLEGVRNSGDPDLRSSVLRLMEREQHREVITEGQSVLRFLDARGRSGASADIREMAI